MARAHKPEGEITRGTTAPNRLRRIDRWIAATQAGPLRSAELPLAVDLGYGASPVTTVELYTRLRAVSPRLEVVGIEIEPDRVAAGLAYLAERPLAGLSFRRGGFELPVDRPPVLVRALNVLRQYEEAAAWQAWDGLCAKLAPQGVLVEGTCNEIGRRAVWVTLTRSGPQTITFAAHLGSLGQPSELAERLPKTLIHRNVPGERVHALLRDFDRCWAVAAPHSPFGPRARWIEAVSLLARTHPVLTRPPYGGRARWRLGEVTLPWSAVAPLRG
ncbi:class I SAM-dependent methyltransferase [Actinomadura rudentiformis]|uniref:Class I SAM-dependent methyltransferase n=1 Tax=Actinomadura rudentiformis TaxID=359158 RepID=A0A6H9YL52_9ACTN|nr:class I SAM-dependent methyltransferase [Actinomadura rudentiformis]KAB2347938.1 class I SAM-dependent methyltransferase [Actinomadura rudentiformis]